MGKTSKSSPILGVIILVLGLAALAFGYYQYQSATSSLGNAIGKVFTGKSQAETQAVLIMIGGGAAALVGALAIILRRKG